MRAYITFFTYLIAFVAALLLLTNTTFLLNWTAPKILSRVAKNIKIGEFHVGRQQYIYPASLVWEDARFRFSTDENDYDITVGKMIVEDILAMSTAKSKILIQARDLYFQSGIVKLEHANLKFNLNLGNYKLQSYYGLIQDAQLHLGQSGISRVSFLMEGSPQTCRIQNLKGEIYGGTLAGQITTNMRSGLGYIAWLELKDLNPKDLARDFDAAFGMVGGKVNGNLRINGNDRDIDLFAANLKLEKGWVAEELIGRLSSGFSSGDGEQGGRRVIELLEMDVHNKNSQKLVVTLRVDDSNYNLHFLNSFDWSVPYGLHQFLFYKPGEK